MDDNLAEVGAARRSRPTDSFFVPILGLAVRSEKACRGMNTFLLAREELRKKMKTLIFYSYKGGQGRSTAVANIATALFRLGKSVLVLDLDVESPGLPPKLINESAFWSDRVERAGGIVPYIIDLIKDRGNPQPPPIQDFTIAVDDEDTRKFLLIPTGKVDEKYEGLLSTNAWNRFTRRDAKNAYTFYRERVVYLDKIDAAARNLDPAIDFLLVDLASGMTPLAESVFAAWAGPILLFFSPDQENIEGTTHILTAIKDVEDKRNTVMGARKMAVRPYPVLSRVGPFVSEEGAAVHRADAAKELGERAENVLYVRSDPKLEEKWHLHFPIDDKVPVENTALTNDYIRIIATVFPDLAPAASVEERILKLRKSLDLRKTINYHYKGFWLDEGILVNMSDEQRNVSFKVNTFCSILDDFHKQMLADLEPTLQGQSRKRVEDEFRRAGDVSGGNFGKDLAKLWKKRGAEDDLSGLLQFWCQFDSDVGFGVLSAKLSRRLPTQGWVRIKGNFLAANRRKADHPANLCMLLAGYVAGVLREVTGKEFGVKHPSRTCMRTEPSPDNS